MAGARKLPGLAADELKVLADKVNILVHAIIQRNILTTIADEKSLPLQTQALNAFSQTFSRITALYGKHIKSSTINLFTDGISALWGGGIVGEINAFVEVLRTEPLFKTALPQLAQMRTTIRDEHKEIDERLYKNWLVQNFNHVTNVLIDSWSTIVEQCIGEKPFLPKEAIDVIEAAMKVYNKIIEEILSQNMLLKSWIKGTGGYSQEENIAWFKQECLKFKSSVPESIGLFKTAFSEQKAHIAKVASANKRVLSQWKTTFDHDCKFMLRDAQFPEQISILEGHIERLQEQKSQLLGLATKENTLLAMTQAALPPIALHEIKVNIDCRAEFIHEYHMHMGGVSACDLQRTHLATLEDSIAKNTRLLATKKQAKEIAAKFVEGRIKTLPNPLLPEEMVDADDIDICRHYKNLIIFADECQRKSPDDLSTEIARQFPHTPIGSKECNAIVIPAIAPLREKCELTIKISSQEIGKKLRTIIDKHIAQVTVDIVENEKIFLDISLDPIDRQLLEKLNNKIDLVKDVLVWLESLGEMTKAELTEQLKEFFGIAPKTPEMIQSAIAGLNIEKHRAYYRSRLDKFNQNLQLVKIKLLAKENNVSGIFRVFKESEAQLKALDDKKSILLGEIHESELKLNRLQSEDQTQQLAIDVSERKIKLLMDEQKILEIKQNQCTESAHQRVAEINAKGAAELSVLSLAANTCNDNIIARSHQLTDLDLKLKEFNKQLSPLKIKQRGFTLSPEPDRKLLQLTANKDEYLEMKASIEAQISELKLQKNSLEHKKIISRENQAKQIAEVTSEREIEIQQIIKEQAENNTQLQTLQLECQILVSEKLANSKQLASETKKHAELQPSLIEVEQTKKEVNEKNQTIINQLNQVIKRQVDAQIEIFSEFTSKAQIILGEAAFFDGSTTSLSSRLKLLVTDSFFKKLPEIESFISDWRTNINAARAAYDQMRENSDVSLVAVTELKPLQALLDTAESQLNAVEESVAARQKFLSETLTLSHAALTGEAKGSLPSTLQFIANKQKIAIEEIKASEANLSATSADLEVKKGEVKVISVEEKFSAVREVLDAARNLDQTAARTTPALTHDSWHTELRDIKESLQSLALVENKTAETFVNTIKAHIAQTDETRLSIENNATDIHRLNTHSKDLAQNAKREALTSMQTALRAHTAQLQQTLNSQQKTISDLETALNDLQYKEMGHDEYLAAFFKILTLIGQAHLTPTHFVEETCLNSIDNHSELANNLKQELKHVRRLQSDSKAKAAELIEIIRQAPDRATAAYENALEEYQNTTINNFRKFDEERTANRQWFDFFDRLWSGILYIVTLAFYSRPTEKIYVYTAIEEILQSVQAFVKNQKRLVDNAIPKSYVTPESSDVPATLDNVRQAFEKNRSLFPQNFAAPHSFFKKLNLPQEADQLFLADRPHIIVGVEEGLKI